MGYFFRQGDQEKLACRGDKRKVEVTIFERNKEIDLMASR
jgi:hypothetical protein